METTQTVLSGDIWIILLLIAAVACVAFAQSRAALKNTEILRDVFDDVLKAMGGTVELDDGDDVIDVARSEFEIMQQTAKNIRAENEKLKAAISAKNKQEKPE